MVDNSNLFPSDDELEKLFASEDEAEETTEEENTEGEPSMENQSTEQSSPDLDKIRELENKIKNLELSQAKKPEPVTEETFGSLDEDDLEELPESVRARVKEVDLLKKKLASMEEAQKQKVVDDRADGYLKDLKNLSKKHPALKDKATRYAVLMYAANGLGDTSKEGFSRAFSILSKSFGTNEGKVNVEKQVKAAKKQKETAPKVGKGGIPSLTTDNTPKTLAEATNMANEFLKKL